MLGRFSLLILTSSLVGCSAAFIPATDDPSQKLHQAYQLLTTYRPVPARRLIDESIQIYKERGDLEGLAYAYTVSTDYYRFKTSDAYKKYFKNYSSSLSGPEPLPLYAVFGPSRSEETKTESKLAIDTYRKVIAESVTAKDYFKASSHYYRLYIHHARSRDDSEACKALDGSIEQHKMGIAVKPEQKVAFDSSKYKSLIEQIEATKRA